MKRIVYLLALSILLIPTISMKPPMAKTGHIHKIIVNIDEALRERALVKELDNVSVFYDKQGRVQYQEESNFELFSKDKVYSILTDLCDIVAFETEKEKVTSETKKANMSLMFGGIGANILNKSQLEHFPSVKLKKVKVKVDEYYVIKMNFVHGGSYRSHGISELDFKIKASIIATNKKGEVLWEKEREIKDFRNVFNDPTIPFNEEDNYFRIKRGVRIFNKFNNEPIGDYVSLSLLEIESCMKLALENVLSE